VFQAHKKIALHRLLYEQDQLLSTSFLQDTRVKITSVVRRPRISTDNSLSVLLVQDSEQLDFIILEDNRHGCRGHATWSSPCPTFSDSCAGRTDVLRLHPAALFEVKDQPAGLVKRLFDSQFKNLTVERPGCKPVQRTLPVSEKCIALQHLRYPSRIVARRQSSHACLPSPRISMAVLRTGFFHC